MTQVTPIYSFPYPEPTDAPDGPTQIHNLALAVETVVARTDKIPTIIAFGASGSLLAAQVTGAKALRIRVRGNGGAGGGVPTTAAGVTSMAGGGGQGAYSEDIIPLTSITFPVTVTVPAAAVGVTNANGGTGSDVSFGTLVIAKGGGGGVVGGAGSAGGGYSGTGGAGGLASGSTGTFKVDGAPGDPGSVISTIFGLPGRGGGDNLRINFNSTPGAAAGEGRGGTGAGNLASQAATRQGGNGAVGYVIVEAIY